jgi:hypothetical protein
MSDVAVIVEQLRSEIQSKTGRVSDFEYLLRKIKDWDIDCFIEHGEFALPIEIRAQIQRVMGYE